MRHAQQHTAPADPVQEQGTPLPRSEFGPADLDARTMLVGEGHAELSESALAPLPPPPAIVAILKGCFLKGTKQMIGFVAQEI